MPMSGLQATMETGMSLRKSRSPLSNEKGRIAALFLLDR